FDASPTPELSTLSLHDALPISLAVFGVVYMVLVREPIVELPRTTVAQTFRSLVFNPARHPDFALVWVGKLFMQIALAFLTTYQLDRKSTRLNSSHVKISYAVFC